MRPVLLLVPPAPTRRGFTFVELLLVVMVLGIMAGVAVPRFQAALNGVALEAASKRLVANLRYARQEAITGGQQLGIEFVPASALYRSLTVDGFTIDDPDHPGTPLEVGFDTPASRVAIASADFGGTEQVMFDFRGDPSAAGNAILTNGDSTVTIDVNAVGEVSITP